MLQTISRSANDCNRRVGDWASANTLTITRAALGIVFLWFGLLKFCPGLCDVELLAQKTMVLLTFGLIPAATCIRVLAIWECAMGLTLLLAPRNTRWGRIALQACVVSLLMHLAGTFLPLLLFPAETWKHLPYAPTLAGQYIAKNLVLMAAAISIGAAVSTPRTQIRPVTETFDVPYIIRRRA